MKKSDIKLKWSKNLFREKLNNIPKKQGIYKLYWVMTGKDIKKNIVIQYVGQASNLNKKIKEMLEFHWWNVVKFAETPKFIRKKRIIKTHELINNYKPPYSNRVSFVSITEINNEKNS